MINLKNKKGSIATDNMGNLILLAIVLGVGIYFVWAYVLHGGGDSIKAVQQCGAITGNSGVCKEVCDSITEYDAGTIGCSGIASQCCVNKNEDYDVLTPAGYGGNKEYDFDVTLVEFVEPLSSGCTITPSSNNDRRKIDCEPGVAHDVRIRLTVKNKYKSTQISAIPFVMINGQTKMANWPQKYATNPQPFGEGATLPIEATIKISASEAMNGRYWEVYGYAQCKTSECMKTDSQSRGIIDSNENPLTIRFTTN